MPPAASSAISADTAYDPTLIEWLSRADRIVHEANGGFPHTPYHQLAELPTALREKMLVVHYPDGFDPPGREIELLRQGQNYWVYRELFAAGSKPDAQARSAQDADLACALGFDVAVSNPAEMEILSRSR